MTTSEAEGTETRDRIPADTFPARLMLARLHAGGLTIQEAATRCGLLNQSWSNWERGRVPRDLLDVVQAISDELDIDRDWLLFGGPLAVAPLKRRGRGGQIRTCAYSSTRVIDRDRPQTSGIRPSTYGASRRPSVDRPAMERQAVVRRRGAAL